MTKDRKLFLSAALSTLVVFLLGASIGNFGLFKAFLQSDLNGNGFSGTNFNSLNATTVNAGAALVQSLNFTNGTGLLTNRIQKIFGNDWDVNASTTPRLSQSNFTPTPFFFEDGIGQANAGGHCFIRIMLPEWATKASGSFYCQTTNVMAFTNSLSDFYFGTGGRVVDGPLQNYPVVCTNGLNWITWTNLTFTTATNCPRYIAIDLGPSTNTSARFIISPITLIYN